MIILKNAKYISDGRIYKSGEILPDNAVTHGLVEKGFAVIMEDKPAKKKDKAEASQENVKVNS